MDQHVSNCDMCQTLEPEGAGPLERILAARLRRRYLAALEAEAILAAREAGHSWEEVALALGTTRQAAWQRWHKRAPRRPAGAEL